MDDAIPRTCPSSCHMWMMEFMITSSNGNIFHVTGTLCGEFTGPGEFPTQRPVTRSFDVFFLICVWINGWVNNREAGDLRRHRSHYDVNVMSKKRVHRARQIWGCNSRKRTFWAGLLSYFAIRIALPSQKKCHRIWWIYQVYENGLGKFCVYPFVYSNMMTHVYLTYGSREAHMCISKLDTHQCINHYLSFCHVHCQTFMYSRLTKFLDKSYSYSVLKSNVRVNACFTLKLKQQGMTFVM